MDGLATWLRLAFRNTVSVGYGSKGSAVLTSKNSYGELQYYENDGTRF
jgi:hypothetical protein